MKISISKEQEELIHHIDGPMLVKASAGSGKTRILTERIKYLLEQQPGSFHVLALTFTNKAALEMKNRLADSKLVEKRAFIGTIHAFCEEVLKKHCYALGFKNMPHILELNEDRIGLLIQVFETNPELKKFYINHDTKRQSEFISNALKYISEQKKNLKGLTKASQASAAENKNIVLMYNEYNDLLNIQNSMDFDDVILFAYKILAERPEIARIYRRQFKYISVDEAQDLNYAQYEFIKILCNGEQKNVFMVGDTNQSLYHFNGSDSKFMNEHFVNDFEAKLAILNTNFRSSKAVIRAANLIKPGSIDDKEAAIEGIFHVESCENEKTEAKWITDKIKNLLHNSSTKVEYEQVGPKDIAILARNKYQFDSLKTILQENDIDYNFRKGNDQLSFESDIMKLFDLGLRIIANPMDQLHFLSILRMLNISDGMERVSASKGTEKLATAFEHFPVGSENHSGYSVLLEAWKLIESNINSFPKALARIEGTLNDKMEFNEHSIVTADILAYKNVWNEYAKNTQQDMKSLQHFRTQLALGISATGKEPAGVTLSTVHLAKGLEYKVVFIIGLTQGGFPDYRALKSGGVALEEEKNSIYVAITRAERQLYLTYPKYRLMPWHKEKPIEQEPSIYIKTLGNLPAQVAQLSAP